MMARSLFWAALAVYETAVVVYFIRAAIRRRNSRRNSWRIK